MMLIMSLDTFLSFKLNSIIPSWLGEWDGGFIFHNLVCPGNTYPSNPELIKVFCPLLVMNSTAESFACILPLFVTCNETSSLFCKKDNAISGLNCSLCSGQVNSDTILGCFQQALAATRY